MEMSGSAEFILRGVKKSFGSLRVLDGIDLVAERESILAVLGPSACGKTTLLYLLAGLLAADAGEMEGLAGKQVSCAFQEPRLLDWLTVEENLAFVLQGRLPSGEVQARIGRFLARFELEPYRAYYPRRLSGGQKQRVAMARAMAYPARLLLMDEPFKSLDLGLKLALIDRFLAEWEAEPRTVVCVTHDVTEALLLADNVVLLSDKPTVVRRIFKVDIPRRERKADSLALLEMERRILGEMLG